MDRTEKSAADRPCSMRQRSMTAVVKRETLLLDVTSPEAAVASGFPRR